MPPSARFTRHFLGWEGAWLPRAAAWLAREWTGAGPLDLSDTLAIVPTRHAGRRLREALAEFAAKHGGAAFPPRAQTPDMLLAQGAAAPDVASPLESLLAWTEALREVDIAAMAEVFPVAPPRRDFAWAWRMAGDLQRLQSQLAEGGLGMAEVVTRAGADFPEAGRWAQLAELERRQIDILRGRGKREPHEARREFSRRPPPPAGLRRIVMLATPDPLPPAIEALSGWSDTLPVDVLIFAPETEADSFDFAGRPTPAAWERRQPDLADFERRVKLCPNPDTEAEHAATIVRAYPEPDGMVALGVADPETLPLLENELARLGIASFNPEGRERRGEAFHTLLAALAALAREPSFEAVAALARCPQLLDGLGQRLGPEFSAAGFLAALDRLWAEHLPPTLDAARAVAPRGGALANGIAFIEEVRAALARGDGADMATEALGLVFGERRFDLASPEDARIAEAAEAWREITRECARARDTFPELTDVEWWDIALALHGRTRHGGDKPAGALDLPGWLELLWEDAPHLVVTGFNDGIVPEAIVGDAFLPESLRERLGLKTNAARFARDAYILQALAASRAKGGRLDILLAKRSGDGDALRPSRLLLQCDDADLPTRVEFLFRPVEATRPNVPWSRAWRLVPRREPPPTRVRVTGLRRWLECPFRFYLEHALRLESVDPAKTELDALDFGTLCHAALEAMAKEPGLRDCDDEPTLREFLHAELERVARRRYGAHPSLPLVVQLESARQRLARAAVLHARERKAGWVVAHVERPFSLDIGGLEVRGKIDRIERHEGSGAWRILDYKTTDAAPTPHRAHLRSPRDEDARRPEWMRTRAGGREQVWADLQLAVYLRAWTAEVGARADISCGYVNLPKAAGESALVIWHELTPELLDAARACADGVAAAIRAGEFWPPAEIPEERDGFAALFHRGARESVAWEESR